MIFVVEFNETDKRLNDLCAAATHQYCEDAVNEKMETAIKWGVIRDYLISASVELDKAREAMVNLYSGINV